MTAAEPVILGHACRDCGRASKKPKCWKCYQRVRISEQRMGYRTSRTPYVPKAATVSVKARKRDWPPAICPEHRSVLQDGRCHRCPVT